MSQSPGTNRSSSSKTFHFVAGLSSGTSGAISLAAHRPSEDPCAAVWVAINTRLLEGYRTLDTAYGLRIRGLLHHSQHHPPTCRGADLGLGLALVIPPRIVAFGQSDVRGRGESVRGVRADALDRSQGPLRIEPIRLQVSAGAARDIYRTERFRGFFSGFGATAVRDAPYAGFYVLFYEQFKKHLSAFYSKAGRDEKGLAATAANTMGSSLSASINFSSGAMASATCSFLTNPFDAIKTRIQLQPHDYRNTLQAAKKMVTEEGVRALYDGLALRMTRKAISSALAWMLYEELVRRAETTWDSHRRIEKSGHV
ncbi:hypothetical protein PG987_004196 [Apiospora arundinis]